MSTTQPLDTLAGVPLFAEMSKRHLKRLVDSAKQVDHQADRVVAQEGLGALAFHLILDGKAEVSRSGSVVRELGPGDYFGEISMIDGKPRSMTVTATTPLRTLVVPHASFVSLLDEEPGVARTLLVGLCERLREAEQRG